MTCCCLVLGVVRLWIWPGEQARGAGPAFGMGATLTAGTGLVSEGGTSFAECSLP